MVNVAEPPTILAEPSEVAPSVKVTVPVAAAGNTVAVSVTFWFCVPGFGLADIDVVVGICVTT